MLTFYFNILIETNFLTSEQYIELLTYIIYGQHHHPNKTYASHDKINKMTFAANQNNDRN